MELREYAAIVWRWLWLIILTAVLVGGSTLVVSLLFPPVYEATTTLEIDQGGDPNENLYTALRSGEEVATTYVQQMQDPVILQDVVAQLDLSMTTKQLQDMTTIEPVRDTQLIRISAESTDPGLAVALADTIAQVFIEREMAQQQARFQAGLNDLEEQIAQVEEEIAETQRKIVALGDSDGPENARMPEFARFEQTRLNSQLANDQARLTTLLMSAEEFRMAMARQTDYLSIFSPAKRPEAPVRPQTMMNTLLGTVMGGMIGLGTALLIEYLDDTIKTPDDIRQAFSVSALAGIPQLNGSSEASSSLIVADNPLHPVAEAFRNLRTSIRFSSIDEPVRTLLITSPTPTNGKTFTAANLAAALAQGEHSVVVIGADLRRPTLHQKFGVSKAPGLTDALLRPEERGAALRETEVEGLRVMPSGSRAHNPAELLSSQRFRDLLAWLEEEVDFVVIDSSPVLAVTDAAVLSTLVDGTIMIADCGETRLPIAAEALQQLDSVGGRVLGIVLNRMSPSAGGYYYYYDYTYGNGHEEEDEGGIRWITKLLNRGRGKKRQSRERKAEVKA